MISGVSFPFLWSPTPKSVMDLVSESHALGLNPQPALPAVGSGESLPPLFCSVSRLGDVRIRVDSPGWRRHGKEEVGCVVAAGKKERESGRRGHKGKDPEFQSS